MRMAAGVPKRPVVSRRQETKPRPYLPPKIKAAFRTSGMMTMQRALLYRSRGMPLSGAFMTSSMEAVAFSRRLSGVISASCALAGAATASATASEIREAMVFALRNGSGILGIGGLLRAYVGYESERNFTTECTEFAESE